MAEAEENGGGAIGDWRALISSPRVIPSRNFLSEGLTSTSFSQILNRSDYALPTADSEKVDEFQANMLEKADECGVFSSRGVGVGFDSPMEISRDLKPPPGISGGSIAERRAARCGFNAPRINTARFRCISPLSSPSVRSPYLTIPPGLSPTTLLDSPVMLPNSQAQPSPTTGTFPLPSLFDGSTRPISSTSNRDKDQGEDADSLFVFKPHLDTVSLQCLSGTENQNVGMADVNHQVLIPAQPQVDFECQAGFLRQTMSKNHAAGSPSDMEVSNDMIVNSKCIALQTAQSGFASDQAPQHEEKMHVEDTGSQRLLEGDQREAYPPMAMGRPSEDGYNWRKYGQKQVKGSEYPRSYYKCTHPNCLMKKKIERSHDGQITEIIYKGIHNHPKPQPSRRSALGSVFPLNEMSETGEGRGSYANKAQGGYAWRSTPLESKDSKVSSDWIADGLERTSSTSVVTEHSDPLSTAQGKHLDILESADTPELSSTLASHNEDEDRATQGSISPGDDDDDESESKRRKKDCCLIETNLASRAAREPRVVVQTDSEVDILDDGYRWRKYGQKVVKGNPNPRSYYKCTNAGCSVRKHVERASHDLKYVITTYEGKHNHEVPAARNSSHVNSTGGNVPPATSNAQTTLTLPRSANIRKSDPQVQDLVPHFERKPNVTNEFFKPINLGGLSMKLPPFQTAMPYGSFGLNANHSEAHQSASIAHVTASEFPISLPMSIPLSTNLAMSGFNFNNLGKPVCPAQSFLGEHQPKEADMRFLRPKQEQKDDAAFETHLPIDHIADASSSVYHQIMRGFPL